MDAKKLGFGLMRLPLTNPDNETSVDLEKLKKLADLFLGAGFSYFDTAPVYHGGQSEAAFRLAVAERFPRARYTLTTKLSPFSLRSREDVIRTFELQLERTGAGYFDYYWLHNINPNTIGIFDSLDCWSFVMKMREKGLIRHLGFSFHGDPELLQHVLLQHPEMEYVQLQINYLDWNSISIRSRECWETARAFQRPVIVMEPVKGGSLARVPAELEEQMKERHPDWSPAAWALRFAASLPGVVMVLSGMNAEEQMRQNLSTLDDFLPLDREEMSFMERSADILNRNILVPCTGCSYCTDGCPRHIPIPKYFALLNAEQQEMDVRGWRPQRNYYMNLTTQYGKASDCIRCGRCEIKCPQHIPIRKFLQQTAQRFEGNL